jgi:hypothetical protein
VGGRATSIVLEEVEEEDVVIEEEEQEKKPSPSLKACVIYKLLKGKRGRSRKQRQKII